MLRSDFVKWTIATTVGTTTTFTAAGAAMNAGFSAGCEQGAKTAAVLSTAGETYQSLVGYAANAWPGENRNGFDKPDQTYKPDDFGRQMLTCPH
jgi:hypothetical protein